MTKEEIIETIEGLYETIEHHKNIGITLIKENGKIKRIISEIKDYINKEIKENEILIERLEGTNSFRIGTSQTIIKELQSILKIIEESEKDENKDY